MILTGDVLDVLPTLNTDSFDAMLTDPPYGLEFMGRDWDKVVPGSDVWRECLRVLKPGALALVFGGTRTFHRLAVALEDAGFELRDTLMWVYGSGFPKSHNISQAIDKAAGAEREIIGPNPHSSPGRTPGVMHIAGGNHRPELEARMRAAGYDKPPVTAPATPEAQRWQGYGTALKPAWEPVLLVRKPSPLTFAETALTHGCGALNIDGCRIPTGDHLRGGTMGGIFGNGKPASKPEAGSIGRWPANLIHDGSEEVVAKFPTSSTTGQRKNTRTAQAEVGATTFRRSSNAPEYTDSGSAARFFYAAKASKAERSAGLAERNGHPTVKPLALAEYLAKLLLPPERDTRRRILVPFAGSGSEMIGALRAGWDEVVGIEREDEYVSIAKQRVAYWREAA